MQRIIKTSNTISSFMQEASKLEAVIIGAGHAGLSASYYLKQLGLEHRVFERGHIGESWRSQRWDSFILNTANGINVLPGADAGDDPEGFCPASQFVSSLEAYAAKFQLPVVDHTNVISVEKPAEDSYFSVIVSENGRVKRHRSRQVLICSGRQNTRKIPAFATRLSADIVQLHTSEYRNSSRLPNGAVLVVGSGQSGCQIAEDLTTQGRKVYLSTSMVGRIPRRYRGKDIMDWLIATRFFEVTTEELTNPSMMHMAPPQLSGTGGGKSTISLQALARKGVTILGTMNDAQGTQMFFRPDATSHAQFADVFSGKVKTMIDAFILKNQVAAPEPEEDKEDQSDPDAACVSHLTSLRLNDHNIRSIIWATGFSADFNYLKLPVLDNDGYPKHHNGMTTVEGLYFLGLPWLRSGKSGLIFGIKEDAAFISEKMHQYAQATSLYPSLVQGR